MCQKLLFLSAACLPVVLFQPAVTPSAEPRSDERPAYKSPLDVTVDEKGQTARVALPKIGRDAVVDLKTGKILEEEAKPNPAHRAKPYYAAWHLPSSSDEFFKAWAEMTRGLLSDAYNVRGAWADKEVVIVPHQRPKFDIPASQVSQGWVFTNRISLIMMPPMRKMPIDTITAVLDEPQRAYADPSDAVRTSTGRIFVVCAGADSVLVLDTVSLKKHGEKKGEEPNYRLMKREDLRASRHFIIAKIPTQANPRRLGLSGDGKTLVVSNHLADSLTVIDTVKLKVIRHISLGGPKPDAARRGEILFNSAKMTFHGQFTCASCHPNGHTDGLVWDLERDGIGNFKKTKSLLGVKDTAPYGWHGSSPTLADRIQGTLRTTHRHEPTKREIADLVAYLESLPPPQPPHVKEADKPAVARGKTIFQDKGRCASCHKRAALDDGKTHDLGLRGPTDTQDDFDTPSLRGVARNAPYLHDGRAATLEEVFTKHNRKKRHGAAHVLTKEELADLIAYLKSL
jgi:YVTN family beta-propeller protein